MGFLDSMVGAMVGAEMVHVVNGLLEQHGGVQGVIGELQSKGLGPAVQSWIAVGPNHPVTPAQMQSAFGDQTLNALAAKAGISPAELAAKLAQVLPHAVDAMTPNGVVPPKA